MMDKANKLWFYHYFIVHYLFQCSGYGAWVNFVEHYAQFKYVKNQTGKRNPFIIFPPSWVAINYKSLIEGHDKVEDVGRQCAI